MATFDYNKTYLTVKKQLKKFGTQKLLRHDVPGDYDPVTETETGGSVEDRDILVYFGSFKTDETLNGVVPQAGSSKIMFTYTDSEETYKPVTGDTVQAEGEYRLEQVVNISPDNESLIVFICEGREINRA